MTIEVEMLSRDAALVVIECPSWLRRVVFGDRSQAVAIRGPVYRRVQLWIYEDTRRVCSARVAAAIEEAAFVQRLRAWLGRLATDPPI